MRRHLLFVLTVLGLVLGAQARVLTIVAILLCGVAEITELVDADDPDPSLAIVFGYALGALGYLIAVPLLILSIL